MSERTPMRHAQTALAGLALVLAVAGSPVSAHADGLASDGRPAALAEAKAAIQQTLLDPDSARFGDVRQFSEDTIRGRVNAKNRAGGYAGSVRFIAGWNRGTLAWEAVTFDPALAPDEVDPALNPDEDAYQILSPESHESAFESLWSDICR
jgi:hypothetical protein